MLGSYEVFAGAFVAMLATMFGAALILFMKNKDCKLHSFMLAFAGGVMAFSAVEMLVQANGSVGLPSAFLGLSIGIAVIALMGRFIPHVHMLIRKKEIEQSKKKAALLAGTITLHNIPEGLSIAAAFAASGPLGWLVAISMALQDIPEGFLTSGPLYCYGMKTNKAIGFGVFSGIVEFFAAVVGFFFLSSFSFLVPFGLSFSAGAMAYVVFHDLLPDSMQNGRARDALLYFAGGIVVAFGLATLLGF